MVKKFFDEGKKLFFRRQESIFSAAFVLMVTYAASMLLGILRERVLVANFYSCCKEQLDVYYAAFRLPDMVFQLVVIGAISASFIPVFSGSLVKDEKLAYRISSSIINMMFFVYLALAGIIFLSSFQLSALIARGFSPAQIDLMARLTRLMLVAQGVFLVSNFFTAIIQSHQRFIIPALSPLVYNLGIILTTVLLAPYWGIWAPTAGVVLGSLLHLFIQFPLALKLGFSYSFVFDRKLPQVREVFRLMIPKTLGLAIYQIEATMAVFLASSLPSGSLTIFHLAQKMMELPVRLVGVSIGQAAFPALSSRKAEGDSARFAETFISSLSQVIYFSFPAMMAVLILRVPLVRLAYGSKTFPWEATLLTGRVIALISLAIFSQSAIQILVRGFYSVHNTKTPLAIGTLCVFVNVFLSVFWGFKLSWGIIGLAAAISFSSFLEAVLLFVFFGKVLPSLFSSQLLFRWLKMLISALISSVFFWSSMRVLDRYFLDTTRTAYLLILTAFSSSVGFLSYLLLTKAMGLDEVDKFYFFLKRLARFRKSYSPPSSLIDSSS